MVGERDKRDIFGGHIAMARVEVVQYLNDEGEVYWDIDHSEGTPLTQLIGLLHTAALELYLRAKDEA